MRIATGNTADQDTPSDRPAAGRSPLSEEQRRWVGEIAAEIKRSEREDMPPPRPANESGHGARAAAALANIAQARA